MVSAVALVTDLNADPARIRAVFERQRDTAIKLRSSTEQRRATPESDAHKRPSRNTMIRSSFCCSQ